MNVHTAEPRISSASLAHATILQIVPALTEHAARAAVNVAHALREVGAHAIIAAESGPLLQELRAGGGEWMPLVSESLNPLTLRRNRQFIETLIAAERIDIIHATTPGAAVSARAATRQKPVWFVTSINEPPTPRWGLREVQSRALADGDCVIVPSAHAANAIIQQHGIRRDRMVVVPHAIDTDIFDLASVDDDRIMALRRQWQVPSRERVVLIPGRVAPWNGQHLLPDVIHNLLDRGCYGAVFVLAGEATTHADYAAAIRQRAEELQVENTLRMPGHCIDMPAALAAADVVVVPALEPLPRGRVVAEAQAMGRPVVATSVGTLPEHVMVPPRIAADLRTGWIVPPADIASLADAILAPLSLDDEDYRALSARARQFATYMFSPMSAACATRAVYTSLLTGDR